MRSFEVVVSMLKKLPPNGVRSLKVVHLIFAFMWLGGAMALTLVPAFILPTNSQEALIYARTIDFIDDWMIIVGANGALLTGLVYGVWTSWGFIGHRWVAAKWLVIVVQVAYGTFVLGPWVTGNVAIAEKMAGPVSQYPDYFYNLRKIAVGGSIQLAFLILVVSISVFRPWKHVRKDYAGTADLPNARPLR
jgi:uncharacterized membrane protein